MNKYIIKGILALTLSTYVNAGVVGTTNLNTSVSESGAAVIDIPVEIAPGINSMTPGISLTYSSQSGFGDAGMGWNLSVGSAIYRCPKTLFTDGETKGINFTESDSFCLDGQRLIKSSGTHGRDGAIYYTEIESFARVEAHGNATEEGPLGCWGF